MGKRIMKFFFILTMMVTVGFVGLIASVTWEQYQDTKKWQNTAFGNKLKDVPPFLARNYVKAEDEEAVEIWRQVSELLKTIEKEEEIPEGNFDDYEAILNKAVKMQETYELVTGEIVERNERLRLYLDLEMALANAYESPDAELLKNVTDRLYGMNLVIDAPLHDRYFERLQTVAKDYESLSAFLSGVLPKLGTVEERTLFVKADVDSEITDAVKKEIETKGLMRFPFVKELYERLESEDWASILRRNEATRSYHEWKAAEEKLKNVTKSQYYSPAEILTYQQALDAGLTVWTDELEGYIIDLSSPVEAIVYNGIVIAEDEYIRYGTPVVVTLNENYIEISESNPPESMETIADESPQAISGVNELEETTESASSTELEWDEDW